MNRVCPMTTAMCYMSCNDGPCAHIPVPEGWDSLTVAPYVVPPAPTQVLPAQPPALPSPRPDFTSARIDMAPAMQPVLEALPSAGDGDNPEVQELASPVENVAKEVVQFHLPTDSAERKRVPLWSGLFRYFPDALVAVARLSYKGNEKHNPGQPLHWSREKSFDHEDCMLRHVMDSGTGETDPDSGELHEVEAAWRSLAVAQLAIERSRK